MRRSCLSTVYGITVWDRPLSSVYSNTVSEDCLATEHCHSLKEILNVSMSFMCVLCPMSMSLMSCLVTFPLPQ